MVFPKHWLQNFLFIVAIGILGYFSMKLYKENNPVEAVKKSPYPLFEIKDYDVVRFDPNGERSYTIVGPHMVHFDDDRGSTLDEPFLTHYTLTQEKDWTARSNEALINEDQSLIIMNDDVVLTKFDKDLKKTTILKTSQLFVHNKGEKVTNDVWTKIYTFPNNTIEGIGLIGFPKAGKFDLLKDVTSYYETIKDEESH